MNKVLINQIFNNTSPVWGNGVEKIINKKSNIKYYLNKYKFIDVWIYQNNVIFALLSSDLKVKLRSGGNNFYNELIEPENINEILNYVPSGICFKKINLLHPALQSLYRERELNQSHDTNYHFCQNHIKWVNKKIFLYSSISKYNLPEFKEIISLGKEAIPFILRRIDECNKDAFFWAYALREITGEDPAKNLLGNSKSKPWLLWGKENGYYNPKNI